MNGDDVLRRTAGRCLHRPMCLMALALLSVSCLAEPRLDCAAVKATAKKLSIDAAASLAIGKLKASVGPKRYRDYNLVGLAFDPKQKVWRMIFNEMTGAIDADPRVWIDDSTAKTCMAIGLGGANCIGEMYPRPLPRMDDDIYCKFDRPRH